MEPPADDLGSFDTQGLTFDEKVRQGVVKMPCLTTPAPTEQGRPAPKRSKGRIDDSTRNRWVAGNRQFAPWHYAKEAMLSSADCDLHLPPVEVKEQLHHMPPGFTHHPEIDDKSRHKILGNSWHLGVARFIMMFVLQWSNPSTTRASKQTGTLDQMMSWSHRHPVQLGPRQMTSSGFAIPWCKDTREHFDAAQQATHPALMEPSLSPSLQQVAECNLAWSEELDTIRSNIIHDVQELVEKWATDTHQWWTNLPKHLQMVYQDQERQGI